MLTYAIWCPEVGFLSEKTTAFLDKIEEATGGRVKIERYWGGTLAKVKEVHPLIERGGVDMGTDVSSYMVEMFPFYSAGLHATSLVDNARYDYEYKDQKAYRQLQKEFPEVRDEITNHNQKFICNYDGTSAVMLSTKPVRTLADLDGLRVRAVGTSVKFDAAAGSVSISIPAIESYEAMSKGVLEAVDTVLEAQVRYKNYEIAKHLTFGLNSYGQKVTYMTAINLDTWNKLPPDIQEIIEALGVEHQIWYHQELEEFTEWAIKMLEEEEGVIIYDFPPADREEIMNRIAFEIYEDYVKKVEGMGFANVRQILDRACELLSYDIYGYE